MRFKKINKLTKRERARLRDLATVESVYNLTGSSSSYRGFSVHRGKSKKSYFRAVANAYENRLNHFVDSGKSQIKYS
jgi:hypothetical protein